MEIGFIGLGRMGGHMVARLTKKHDVYVWNRSPDPVKLAVKNGAKATSSVEEMLSKLKQKKKVVWLMLPSGSVTEDFFQKTIKLLKKGDVLIEGANSNFHDSVRRHADAKKLGIEMLDIGVSGGLIGAKQGYALMIGGQKETFDFCIPYFEALSIKEGYALVGGNGAGHYVKMVHNAIEYGMMQAIGEGFDLLEKGSYDNLDLKQISHLWNHGTIVSSFLMEMAENALTKDKKLSSLEPFVNDSGEGRWSAIEAMEKSVPFVVNTYALHARYISRDKDSFAFRMLAAIRNEFGGHEVKKRN